MIKKAELIQKIRSSAEEILSSTGFITIIEGLSEDTGVSYVQEEKAVDFSIQVETQDQKNYWLFFEVKSLGQPRYARMAVGQLRELMSFGKNIYCILAAPYILKESQDICLQNGIGFIDLAGNCLFKFNSVYVSVQGRQNPYPTTRPLKFLFAPAASRGLRALILNPKRQWLVRELADEAGISLGQASNLKQRLLDFEFIRETDIAVKKGKKFMLSNAELLLKKWAENYSYVKNRMRHFYSFDDAATIENKLSDYLTSKNILYAFTLTSGASFVAPMLRYSRVFAYVKDRIEDVAKALNLKEVSSGANVSLLEPYDQGVFYGLQEFCRKDQIQSFRVVSDIQLYLDLKSYKERGEEAAEFIYEQRLKKQWS